MKTYKIWIETIDALGGRSGLPPVTIRGSDVSIAVKRALSGWVPHSEKGDITTAGGKPIEVSKYRTLRISVELAR